MIEGPQQSPPGADHVIANKLGTMPSRVSDILAENTHVGSRDQATKMVAQPTTD